MYTPMEIHWRDRFIDLVETFAKWSKDPSRKIGCVIVSADRGIIGHGYNGFPKGVPDVADAFYNKEYKRLRMIHAELNAVLNSSSNLADSTLFTNRFPCHTCAGVIVQKNIGKIVVPAPYLKHKDWGESWKASLAILHEKVSIEYVKSYYSGK